MIRAVIRGLMLAVLIAEAVKAGNVPPLALILLGVATIILRDDRR